MKKFIGLLLVVGFLPPQALGGSEPTALTLRDCYELALKQSEEVALRRELIIESEAHFQQALSGILPRFSFSSSDKRQDGSGGSQFTLRNVPERKFVLTQPLFSGFKEFAAMAGSKGEQHQRIQEKTRAEQLLLIDLSEAFYLLLEQREDLRVLETIRKALLERVSELKGREQLGRSRSSEVVTVQAQLYRLEAERELVRNREAIARQLLEFLTGSERIDALLEPDLGLLPAEIEETYLAESIARPDVKAAEEAAGIAKQQVRVARAKFFPTVSVEGNYYVERVGVAKDVTWDAALKVDVPIFQGGEAVGSVREATSQVRQALLRLSEARRRVIREVRDAYADFEAARARTEALTKALEATEESYGFQVEEYRLNLVSNLDVLKTLQDLEDARRDFIHSQYEAKRRYWRLKATAGETL